MIMFMGKDGGILTASLGVLPDDVDIHSFYDKVQPDGIDPPAILARAKLRDLWPVIEDILVAPYREAEWLLVCAESFPP